MPDDAPAQGPLRLQVPEMALEAMVVEAQPMPDGRRLWRFRFGTEDEG